MSNTTVTMSSVISIPSGPSLFGRSMRSTEPTTTTPPTPPPTPDPHEYEKSAYKVQLDNRALDLLKDHIRLSRGMQITAPPADKRPMNYAKPPKVAPRTNETSRIRAELRKYRLIQRCGELAKHFMGKDSELFPDGKALTSEQERELLNKAKHLTAEQIAAEKHAAEMEYLKYMAERCKTQANYRPNLSSELRLKHTHGEPVLSSTFQHYYLNYEKPPFHFAREYKSFPRWKLPPIDKKKEIWYHPLLDDGGVPLHAQPKPPPPPDGLTARQRSRPPLRPHSKRSSKVRKLKPTKRPPWNFSIPAGYMEEEEEPKPKASEGAKAPSSRVHI